MAYHHQQASNYSEALHYEQMNVSEERHNVMNMTSPSHFNEPNNNTIFPNHEMIGGQSTASHMFPTTNDHEVLLDVSQSVMSSPMDGIYTMQNNYFNS